MGSVNTKITQTGLIPLSKGAKAHVQKGIMRDALWSAKRKLYENAYLPLTERKNSLINSIESTKSDIAKYKRNSVKAKNSFDKEFWEGKAFDEREGLIKSYNQLS